MRLTHAKRDGNDSNGLLSGAYSFCACGGYGLPDRENWASVGIFALQSFRRAPDEGEPGARSGRKWTPNAASLQLTLHKFYELFIDQGFYPRAPIPNISNALNLVKGCN